MKRTLLLVSALLLSLAFANTLLADSLTIGVNNDANCIPFACNVTGTSSGWVMTYQQVYGSASFTGSQPLNISAITFFHSTENANQTLLNGTYTINFWLTPVAVGALNTTAANNHGTFLGQFYSGHLGGTMPSGVLTINGTPFIYDPSLGNLLFEVLIFDQENVDNTGSNGYLQADNTGLSSRAVISGQWGFSSTVGLVTQFTYTPDPPGPTEIPEPASMVLFGSGLIGIGLHLRRRFLKR